MRKMIAGTAAIVTAAALALAGCAPAAQQSTTAAKPMEICYITAAESHAYATPANEAFKAAAKDAGVNVTMLSQNFDVQTGTEQLNTCVSRKPDGIVLWPLDPTAYVSGLTAAKAAGIPVVLINTPMGDKAMELVASFTGPDVTQEGQMSGEAMNTALGGKGNVVIIAGQAGNATTIGRTDGFTGKLKDLGSAIKVLQTVNADFDQQKALVASRDLITRFGDGIDGVFANDDTMARGFIDAWKEAGKDMKKIPAIVGVNGQKDAFQSIKDGEMVATILQSPVEDGRLALNTIVAAAKKQTVEHRIPIPLTSVTKDNVGTLQPAF